MLLRNILLVLLVCAWFNPLQQAFAHPHILDVKTGEEIDFQAMLADLADVQVIYIGESHGDAGHHRMQLTIIDALARKTPALAVGLEMFQVDFQQDLDRWVAGKLDENEFLPIYEQNWSWWPGYRPIFEYAKDRQVPLVALNISRDITRQVARNGFDSLTAEQLQGIEGAPCIVDPEYEDFIRRALGGHGHNQPNFFYFCEAQLLWDISMARHLARFIAKNPEHKILVLAGNGHSWKYGIPSQLRKIMPLAYRVILPEVRGRLDATNVGLNDADYLWRDFGADSWQAEY